MAEAHSLAPLPEDWHRALAVVAHPDDLEDCGHALQQIREDFVATDPGANHTPDTRQEKSEEYAQQLVSPPHAGGANVLGNLLQFTHGRRS